MSTDHEAIPLHSRTIGTVYAELTDSVITVDHVYHPDGSFDCDNCGKPGHDPGQVGLLLVGASDDDDESASVLLSAEEALLLANRLKRAVDLILLSQEDLPDIEREAARFEVHSETGEAG